MLMMRLICLNDSLLTNALPCGTWK
jgi:hypothetical protein